MERDPFAVRGIHEVQYHRKSMLAIRAVLPHAQQAFILDSKGQQRYPMTRCDDDSMFETVFPRRKQPFPYQIETIDSNGKQQIFADAYAFPEVLSEQELKAFHAGRHERVYDVLGCHLAEVQGVTGAVFAVWAPHAKQVSVVGNFNNWDQRMHPMRLRKKWGVWELFVPGVTEGDQYQYALTTRTNAQALKTDPYGFAHTFNGNEVSLVTDLARFQWTDQIWMRQRALHDPLKKPLSAYEVHLGSWMRVPEENNRFLTYRELAEKLIPYVKNMGFTHIELLPVAEHPFYPSWGYQVTGYYAPTSRYGTPDDFMYFVNACHAQGIGVIMDWVPAHFPKDDFSLGEFDGTPLYEHADPYMSEHKDWGTLVFDYGKPEVKNFLLANALFWFEKYHIDGIRVDAVASMLYLDYSRKPGEWTPNAYGGHENLDAIAFLKELNTVVHKRFPGVMTIAEESTSWLGVTYPAYLGGLDFTLKWNLGWMNDMLHYLSHDPIYRKFVHTMVPFALLYAFHEHFMLELSHDEVVHGKKSMLAKMPGDDWEKFANLRALYGFMFGHPGKKLLFMGGEFGQWNEWNHDQSLDWHLLSDDQHQGLQQYVQDLNALYIAEPALYADHLREQGFAWIDYQDFQHSIVSFMRKTPDDMAQSVIFLCNFTPVPRYCYRVGVPLSGWYVELLNSDHAIYGGSHTGNPEGCLAEPIPWQGQPYSINITLPPLSTLIIKPVGEQTPAPETPEELPAQGFLNRQEQSEQSTEITPQIEKSLQSPDQPDMIADANSVTGTTSARDISQLHGEEIITELSETDRIARPQGSRDAILAQAHPLRHTKKSSG